MRKATGVILVNKKGEILMQHRDTKPDILWPNTWAIPGGLVEQGEHPKSGAIRELQEETGYLVKNPKLFFKGNWVGADGKEADHYFYWARFDGKQKIGCFEGQEFRFVGKEEYEGLYQVPNQVPIVMNAYEELK